MIPETSKNNQVEIWKAVSFPYKWKKFKIIFQNESWADINFLNDRKGNFWLFGSKSMDSFDDHNSELYIYKVEGKFFNKIIPHKKNPVIIDSRIARNAGKIFFNHKSEMIRPSQKNVREDYGYGLNFGKITKLNLNDYEEKNLKSFDLSNNVSFSGIHHFDINNRIILIDKLKNN